jgi:lipopolysaccharide transport system ATP-binding protein
MYVVQKLCQKALWIHDGAVKQSGDVFPVTQAYLAWHEKQTAKEQELRMQAKGGGTFYRIDKLTLAGADADNPPDFAMGDNLDAELHIYSPDDRAPVGVFGVVRADGTPVYGVVSDNEGVEPVRLSEKHYCFRIRFNDISLLPGSYTLRGHSMDPEGLRVFDNREMTFTMTGSTKELGYVKLPHQWLD